MKAILIIISILAISFTTSAQSQAETYIKEAQTYLAQKEYKQAQMSLQDAINDLNLIIAEQIAASLPAEINGLKASGNDNVNTGAMGIIGGGMTISKSYENPSKQENQADINIVANSPMMASMSMFLSNPSMLGQGYKSVRVGQQRAIFKTEMSDFYMDNGSSKPIRSSEIQIPLTSTLITMTLRGFATEAEELAFASKIDLVALRTALGE